MPAEGSAAAEVTATEGEAHAKKDFRGIWRPIGKVAEVKSWVNQRKRDRIARAAAIASSIQVSTVDSPCDADRTV